MKPRTRSIWKLITRILKRSNHRQPWQAVSDCSTIVFNILTTNKRIKADKLQLDCFHFFFCMAGQLYSCSIQNCSFKTYEKATLEAHSRKHVKVKPFKCRICSARFETRELAGVHAKTHCPDFFKCGTCSSTFRSKVCF